MITAKIVFALYFDKINGLRKTKNSCVIIMSKTMTHSRNASYGIERYVLERTVEKNEKLESLNELGKLW